MGDVVATGEVNTLALKVRLVTAEVAEKVGGRARDQEEQGEKGPRGHALVVAARSRSVRALRRRGRGKVAGFGDREEIGEQ